jgi:transmembrane sensor
MNAAAYHRAETLWNESSKLSDDPDILAALSAAKATPRPTGNFRTAMLVLVGALTMAVAAFCFVRLGPVFTEPVYRTAVGERSLANLDDGSSVQIDADSEVATRFDGTMRRVVLKRGQAFFAVRHDAERPFVVDAGNGLTVTALGTRFDVLRLGNKVRISLLEGSVAIRRDDVLLTTLKPGEVVDVGRTGSAVPIGRSIDDALGWRTGRLSFRDTPLEQAIAEMNRYARHPIEPGARTNAQELISGEFSTDDPDGFADAVKALLGRNAVREISR